MRAATEAGSRSSGSFCLLHWDLKVAIPWGGREMFLLLHPLLFTEVQPLHLKAFALFLTSQFVIIVPPAAFIHPQECQ